MIPLSNIEAYVSTWPFCKNKFLNIFWISNSITERIKKPTVRNFRSARSSIILKKFIYSCVKYDCLQREDLLVRVSLISSKRRHPQIVVKMSLFCQPAVPYDNLPKSRRSRQIQLSLKIRMNRDQVFTFTHTVTSQVSSWPRSCWRLLPFSDYYHSQNRPSFT